jgi:hypothetical protein
VIPYHPAYRKLSSICFKHDVTVSWLNGGTHMIQACKAIVPTALTTEMSSWLYGAEKRGGGGSFVFCNKKAYVQHETIPT